MPQGFFRWPAFFPLSVPLLAALGVAFLGLYFTFPQTRAFWRFFLLFCVAVMALLFVPLVSIVLFF